MFVADPFRPMAAEYPEKSVAMAKESANVSLLKRLDVGNMGTAVLFAQDVVWHLFNPLLPDIQDDYAVLKVKLTVRTV